MQGLGTLFLGWGDLGLNLYHLNVKLYNVEQVIFFWALVFLSGKLGSNSNMINWEKSLYITWHITLSLTITLVKLHCGSPRKILVGTQKQLLLNSLRYRPLVCPPFCPPTPPFTLAYRTIAKWIIWNENILNYLNSQKIKMPYVLFTKTNQQKHKTATTLLVTAPLPSPKIHTQHSTGNPGSGRIFLGARPLSCQSTTELIISTPPWF